MDVSDLERRISDVQSRIEVEKACKQGAENMIAKLKDENARQQCEQTILESERRIHYLSNELCKLQISLCKEKNVEVPPELLDMAQRMSISQDMTSPSSVTSSQSQVFSFRNSTSSRFANRITSFHSDSGLVEASSSRASISMGRRISRNSSSVIQSLFSGFTKQKSVSNTSLSSTSLTSLAIPECQWFIPFGKFKINLEKNSCVDFWQGGVELSPEKIKYKLEEINYKLSLESKIKAGIERMYQTVTENTEASSKKNATEVKKKYQESTEKVLLLKKACSRYRSLDLSQEDDANTSNSSINGTISLISSQFTSVVPEHLQDKQPFTGKIKLKLSGLHNISGKRTIKSELYILVKADGNQKAKSRSSRSKFNDTLTVEVEKGYDLEVLIYDDNDTLLALFWGRLQDIEKSTSLRKATLMTVSLDRATQRIEAENLPADFDPKKCPEDIYYTFELEPAGYLQCHVSITPTKAVTPKIEGVSRQRAVKKTFPVNGHKFAALQFYQPMKCAYCTDFLLSGQGYQCISKIYLFFRYPYLI